MDLEDIRREYLLGGLRREHLHDHPIEQFKNWLEQAVTSGIPDPTAMVLASVDRTGQPDQRIVLLKHLDASGFVFFTNYQSAKAQQIEQNPKVSLHFPWHCMERQVRINGRARRISSAESLRYFLTRPRDSQIAAWASGQSKRIDSRQFLLQQFEAVRAKFAQGSIPLPDFWGGYRVEPHRLEFWQGGGSRLHDRFEYCLTQEQSWDISRLAP